MKYTRVVPVAAMLLSASWSGIFAGSTETGLYARAWLMLGDVEPSQEPTGRTNNDQLLSACSWGKGGIRPDANDTLVHANFSHPINVYLPAGTILTCWVGPSSMSSSDFFQADLIVEMHIDESIHVCR